MRALAQFPWATLGRRESSAEFFKKHAEQKQRAPLLAQAPSFSLVLSVPDGLAPEPFRQAVQALRLQSYARWSAVFVGKASDERLRAIVHEEGDRRMSWKTAGAEDSVVRMKNLGAEGASGEWIGFFSAADLLSPVALFFFALELQGIEPRDLLYANEVSVDGQGTRLASFFSKPEWSWFNLIHFNYIGKPWLVRRALWDALGGFDGEAQGHHEHDFLLRLSERTEAWRHLPYFLYYRRQGEPFVASDGILERRVRAHLQRREIPAEVSLVGKGGRPRVRVVPEITYPEKHLVSVVICFRDRAEWTIRSLRAVLEQAGRIPLEVVLVNNESRPEELAKVRAALVGGLWPVRIVDFDGPFNFAEMHNQAVRRYCQGRYLFLLNNDVFLQGTGILEELVGWAQYPWVGTVGLCLRYSHGAIQYAGISARFGGGARLVRVGHTQGENTLAYESHEVFANTFAASLLRRETFDAIGGLRALDLANGFGDVAFGFECLRRGLHHLYLGHLEGTHLESASRGMEYEYWEELVIERAYPEILQRMLRQDLGFDRVPEADYSVPSFLRQAIIYQLRQKAPWLDPLKPPVKKLLRSFRVKGDNREENENLHR